MEAEKKKKRKKERKKEEVLNKSMKYFISKLG
jgi:hypothetical protein